MLTSTGNGAFGTIDVQKWTSQENSDEPTQHNSLSHGEICSEHLQVGVNTINLIDKKQSTGLQLGHPGGNQVKRIL